MRADELSTNYLFLKDKRTYCDAAPEEPSSHGSVVASSKISGEMVVVTGGDGAAKSCTAAPLLPSNTFLTVVKSGNGPLWQPLLKSSKSRVHIDTPPKPVIKIHVYILFLSDLDV